MHVYIWIYIKRYDYQEHVDILVSLMFVLNSF